jgi:hypothetical protein
MSHPPNHVTPAGIPCNVEQPSTATLMAAEFCVNGDCAPYDGVPGDWCHRCKYGGASNPHRDMQKVANRVGEWHRTIFGEYDPLDHIRAIATKAQEEARELEADPGDPMEIADLLICGLACADRWGLDPVEIVERKLAILKGRGMDQLQRDKDRGIVQAKDRAQPAAAPTEQSLRAAFEEVLPVAVDLDRRFGTHLGELFVAGSINQAKYGCQRALVVEDADQFKRELIELAAVCLRYLAETGEAGK